MIYYVGGDIFDSSAQTIVDPVNTVGVMGKGLALKFKKKYPRTFARYQYACKYAGFACGSLLVTKEADHWTMCFPTKKDWRNKSSLSYIEAGLRAFRGGYEKQGITSAAFPRLGCGLGGLTWSQVEPLIEKYLGDLPIDIYIYKDFEEKNNDNQDSKITRLGA